MAAPVQEIGAQISTGGGAIVCRAEALCRHARRQQTTLCRSAQPLGQNLRGMQALASGAEVLGRW